MVWWYATVLLYVAAVLVLVVAFPDVSNTWVSIFVLASGLTASVGALIAAIKTRGEPHADDIGEDSSGGHVLHGGEAAHGQGGHGAALRRPGAGPDHQGGGSWDS
jgi:hypothetical protein